MNFKRYFTGVFIATALCTGITANAAVTAVQPDRNIGVYTSNQAVSFAVTRDVATADENFTYTIENLDKKVIRTGTVSAAAGSTEFTIKQGTFLPGWYRVRLFDSTGAEIDIFASFTVVEKLNNKPESSPFSTMLYGFSGISSSKIPKYVEALGIVGVNTVRDGTSWQHNPSSTIDNMVNPISENGLKALLTYEVPKTAAESNPERLIKGNLYYTGEMLKNQSKNYKGKVAAYEIINEPDLASTDNFSADVFSSYYKIAALAIEEGNPDALKSFGGLADASIGFGELMMQNGVANYTDSLNVHKHNNYSSKNIISFKDGRIKKIRNWSAIYGNNQPLWNTEAGLNTPIEDDGVTVEGYLRTQARYAITSAVQSISAYGTENHVWFIARHYLENGANWGTAAPNDNTYPAFYSLSMLTRGLGEGKPIGELNGASQNVSGYFFDAGENDAVVLWNNSDGTSYQQLKTSSGVSVKNLIGGTESVYASSKNVVNIPVTSDPIIVIFNGRADESDYIKKAFESNYVRDITRTTGEKVVLQAIWDDTDLSISNGRYVLTPGETYNIKLNVYNLNNEAVNGNITLTADDGIEIVGDATKAFSDRALDYKTKDTVVTLNYTVKLKSDVANQYKGHFSFGGTANGSAITETVCGYVAEHELSRSNIGTITNFTGSSLWKDGNKTEGNKLNVSTSISNSGTSATFTATIKTGASKFWFPVLNKSTSVLANSDGFVFDLTGTSIGDSTEMIMYANVSNGSYSVKLGKLETGTKTVVVPWSKMYAYNGDIPEKLDASKITEISLGFQTRGSSQVKYTVSTPGYYKLNGSEEVEQEEFIKFTGVDKNGVYKEGSRHNNLNIDGEFDDIYLNYEKYTDYIERDGGACVELSKLDPGAYSLIVTRNAGFGKIEYNEFTFCIKAADDYTSDGVFY